VIPLQTLTRYQVILQESHVNLNAKNSLKLTIIRQVWRLNMNITLNMHRYICSLGERGVVEQDLVVAASYAVCKSGLIGCINIARLCVSKILKKGEVRELQIHWPWSGLFERSEFRGYRWAVGDIWCIRVGEYLVGMTIHITISIELGIESCGYRYGSINCGT
jgi:hypothetical protein